MNSYGKNQNEGYKDYEDNYDNEFPYDGVKNASDLDFYNDDEKGKDDLKSYDYLDENAVDYYQPFEDL